MHHGRCSRSIGTLLLMLMLAACGGGGDTAPPPASTGIGAAGGTVNGPSGAQVIVPAGALTTNTTIGIEQSNVGAPALPAGVTAFGPIFAFTPHGTTFATLVSITVPFDPASVPVGTTPALYKTNATQTAWEVVPGATVSGSAMSGQVSGFSFLTSGTPPVRLVSELTEKTWEFGVSGVEGRVVPVDDHCALVFDELNCGVFIERDPDMPIVPPGVAQGQANATVFSNPPGTTYWTTAQAPRGGDPADLTPDYGLDSDLKLFYTFRKSAANATLKFVVTVAQLEGLDYGGTAASLLSCPWLDANTPPDSVDAICQYELMKAENRLTMNAWLLLRPDDFYSIGGVVQLRGGRQNWLVITAGTGGEEHMLWNDASFDQNVDAEGDGSGSHANINLKGPITIEVPLGNVNVGEVFNVQTHASSSAWNYKQGETYLFAGLRDPAKIKGLDFSFTGLEQLPAQHDIRSAPVAQPCTAGPDPVAGSLQFSSASFRSPERPGAALVSVTRSGGTRGAVSVLFETADGTALAGSDYQPVKSVVKFADGEAGTRTIAVPLVLDNVAEPDETVNLKLSMFSGCAVLGTQSTATLTILDDDRPIPVTQSYTVGGTVSGLTGSGLVLREVLGGSANLSAANGAFTFAGALLSGSAYDVRVETQPTNPIQICSVANGVGTIANTNVTNVAVICTTPAPNGSLDPSFGNAGKVASNIAFVTSAFDARMGMALQADGRILLVGGLKLARFNGDGTPDMNFGAAGVVTVPFNGSPYDMAQGVAVQTDGRIVVVGTISIGGTTADKQDFALARFNTDGTLDTGFGTGGIVTTDFNGNQDIARRIVIQPDGKLLVTGYSTFVAPTLTENQFALARYNVDGSPDTSFATGLGRTTTGFGGTFNRVQGLTLQRDGRIVVAGVTALNGGTPNQNVGVARYLGASTLINGHIVSSGSEDPDFNDPDLGGPLTGGQISTDLNRGGGEAVDVVEQLGIDGQMLVAVNVGKFGLATFIHITDTSTGKVYGGYFPSPLLPALVDFSGKTDQVSAMALQADGKVLMVGRSDIYGANPDMAIARFVPGSQGASIDTTFGSAGKVTVDFFGAFDRAEAVAVQPDGKIIVGGYARNAGTTVFALVRLMP